LLSLSRIEMNEHQPPAGRVALGPILQSVHDSLSMKAAKHGVEIALPPLVNLPEIPGDPDELLQAVQNLVDNAIKYGGSPSQVTVTCRRIEDPAALRERLTGARNSKAMIALDVSDQGAGIAREHIPRLTERFYRVDPARSRELGGTGLGLAIVKHIVNRHRGSLEIQSEPGRGSTFTIYLPAE
jgi:two-component system phosphate regulon sensor histidine kinase PhoR